MKAAWTGSTLQRRLHWDRCDRRWVQQGLCSAVLEVKTPPKHKRLRRGTRHSAFIPSASHVHC